MPEFQSASPLVNPDLIALCKTQMKILSDVFNVVWSAIYLTETFGENESTRLIPLVFYPSVESVVSQGVSPAKLPEAISSETKFSDELIQLSTNNYAKFESKCSTWKNEQNQLVIPLIYQDIVFGILVVKLAEKHSLTPSQLEDIEQISQTIAIACLLERRSIWYKQQLIEQKTLLPPNRDAIDNLLHQLRNPITALKTFSKLLIKRLVPEDRNYTIAESILQQTNRLQELLQQFEADLASQATKISPLDVNSTRLETGEKNNFLLPGDENPTEVIDLPQFLAPLLVSYQAIANEKGLTLQTEIPQSLPPVIGNSKALREVISNLIDNALKYTPKPGIIKISTGLKQKIADKNYQGIAIADTGVGIPAQDQEKLFTRYYRGVQAEGNIPGTGLGLAIAKDLLTKMQGKIELISPNYLGQNPGTTFIVWLPEKEN